MPLTDATRVHMREIIARYPQARSALLPMLHLVQAEEGYVTAEGIAVCAEEVGVTPAEVAAVATFYTMYKRHDVGEYHVGICVNPGCGLLGGDELWKMTCDKLGIGDHEVTEDGVFSLERIECQAACTHAPVVTVNWEFLDDQTPESLRTALDTLADGGEVPATRGPVIRKFTDTERTLTGFDDGLAAAPAVDDKMLAGLKVARERGMSAPPANGQGGA
jgi:NADH-quinone oxidoreductase subunit E